MGNKKLPSGNHTWVIFQHAMFHYRRLTSMIIYIYIPLWINEPLLTMNHYESLTSIKTIFNHHSPYSTIIFRILFRAPNHQLLPRLACEAHLQLLTGPVLHLQRQLEACAEFLFGFFTWKKLEKMQGKWMTAHMTMSWLWLWIHLSIDLMGYSNG